MNTLSWYNATLNGIQVYDGFTEKVVRFVFPYGKVLKGKTFQTMLYTLLPDGTIEGDKELSNTQTTLQDRAIQSYTFSQKVNRDSLWNMYISNNIAMKTFVNGLELSQIWTLTIDNMDDKEQSKYFNNFDLIPIKQASNDFYDMGAFHGFQASIEKLFGSPQSLDDFYIGVSLAKQNNEGLVIGKSNNLIHYLTSAHILPSFKRYLVDGSVDTSTLTFKTRLYDFKKESFKTNTNQLNESNTLSVQSHKTFTMSPNVEYAIYTKNTFEGMLVCTPMEQFQIGRFIMLNR